MTYRLQSAISAAEADELDKAIGNAADVNNPVGIAEAGRALPDHLLSRSWEHPAVKEFARCSQ